MSKSNRRWVDINEIAYLLNSPDITVEVVKMWANHYLKYRIRRGKRRYCTKSFSAVLKRARIEGRLFCIDKRTGEIADDATLANYFGFVPDRNDFQLFDNGTGILFERTGTTH